MHAWYVSIKTKTCVVPYGAGRASLLLTSVAMGDFEAFLHSRLYNRKSVLADHHCGFSVIALHVNPNFPISKY